MEGEIYYYTKLMLFGKFYYQHCCQDFYTLYEYISSLTPPSSEDIHTMVLWMHSSLIIPFSGQGIKKSEFSYSYNLCLFPILGVEKNDDAKRNFFQ